MIALPTIPTNVTPLTVSALNGQVKAVLEGTFASVWAIGEIGSLACPSSGHLYFNLKDKNAVVRAVMWRTVAQRHRYALKDGLEVVVRGKITVYAPRGDYQLIVDELYQKGRGAQDLALRQLKEKLQKLGYFAPARKRQLPAFPRRIALVSSPSGAAIRDMLEILARRWPAADVWVVGVCVQGPTAAQDIATALDRLNEFPGTDVVILGRGGGSSEDLAAFNTEVVAKAIFASKSPVISAVGHEIDVTVADLVADQRALTPSEAVEIATPDRAELLANLRARGQRLHDLLLASYHTRRHQLDSLVQRRVFRFPLEKIRDQERRLDDREARLRRGLQARLKLQRQRLDAIAGKLDSLSPLNVLARGYSLTRSIPGKRVLRSVHQMKVGQAVEIVLADGRVNAAVQSKEANDESAKEPQTFEEALLELEKIVRDLEDGETSLEQSLARYEQGVGLLKRCYEQLRKVEQRIVELTGKDEDGNPTLRPFDHTASIKQG